MKRKSNSQSESSGDPLRVLEVFDSLEVGPVKLTNKKLSMPYKLHYKKQSDSTELIYSYEEDVFDPTDPAAINLANMIGAQVALNYGLFCKKIIFRGNYDNADKRFIQDMMENTAREIYVLKFLEPNPFLIGKAKNLPVVKRQKYCRSQIEFPDSKSKTCKTSWGIGSESNRYCILSSGGKDSLLSYGLLNELGKETHPIFVNESGRHWFTALNSYRYFRENIPNTARVWANSDRLFNWMIRHMPFIRKDYSRIRADEYPIRLWTVAVFLFGVLPLMRKRGIGRLIIGDEYDTSEKTSYKGITHYSGLYDQSRYFDEAMSRYYKSKGWDVSQFSILRPLSEIMIQNILVKRYPDLQKQQISCHAAHQVENRIFPCGKCEKCRRIVGILKAMAADPANCGYDEKQIVHCLKEIASKPIHQESLGAEHLNYTLKEKGLIILPEAKAKSIRPHPEVMMLRFHPERSPMQSMPVDLREPLYRIYLNYATDSVRHVGRKWVEIDPFSDPAIYSPYPCENVKV